MKTILSSTRDHYLTRVSIFLVAVVLLAGMVGCTDARYNLTVSVSCTECGDVTEPKQADYNYPQNTVVNLVAEPEEGYRFLEWTGNNVTNIANTTAASTTITIRGSYSIIANFEKEIIPIEDWDDLHAIRYNLGTNYKLMNDLNSTTANYTELANSTANGGDGWAPVGTQGEPFRGSFDGNGHKIEDLFINRSTSYVGLFGYVEGGVVENVGVVNATVEGGSYYVGGLVGRSEGGNVSDSYFIGDVTGRDNVGGLVGFSEGGSVSNSHSTGNVTGKNKVGGLVGYNYEEGKVSDSYSTGNVTGIDAVGGLVGLNHKSQVSNSHYNYDKVLINGKNIITIGALFGEDFDRWLADGKSLDIRLSQEGLYYAVNNVTDFKELLAFGQDGLHFQLKNDIDLAAEPNFYIPYFAGYFEGNSHTVSNLSLDFDFVYSIGLFGCLAHGAGVTQVNVENVNITGASFIGGLVGASFEGYVTSSYSNGSVTGHDYVGGLVGCNCRESTVDYCYSSSNVTGHMYVGGLAGENEGSVSGSNSTGEVTGLRDYVGDYIGGLVGRNKGGISMCHSAGSVSGHNHVGGLAGRNQGTVVDKSSSIGSVDGGSHVGGLVGSNNCQEMNDVKSSKSTGNVTGDDDVGGLVGSNEAGLVSNCYSTGNVTAKTANSGVVGGLVGDNDGRVNSSYSTGMVTGGKDVGGLVGRNRNGTVTRSFWDIETSRQAHSAGEGEGKAEGKTTDYMKRYDTFTDWQILPVFPGSKPSSTPPWRIVDFATCPYAATYPFLSWESELYLTAILAMTV